MDRVRTLVGPLSGILFVFAVVVRVIIGSFDAEPSDSAGSVLAELRESADDITVGVWIGMLGVGFLLIFIAHLRTKLRDGGASWAADAFLAGGVVLAAALTVVAAIELAGATAGDHGHTEVAQGAVDFLWNITLILSPGLLAVGIAAAVASFSHRALPTWLGGFAILVAVGAVVPWIGIIVFVVWVLAASIVEIVYASRTPAAADTG